MTNSKHKTFYS